MDETDIENNISEIFEEIRKNQSLKFVSKERQPMPPCWKIYLHKGQDRLTTLEIHDTLFENNPKDWRKVFLTQFLDASSLEEDKTTIFN